MNFDPSVIQAFQSFMQLLQLPQATSATPPSAPTDALAHDMLYTALIGQQPATHNELKAFLTGLRMPCLNGFNFMEVPIIWAIRFKLLLIFCF